MKVKKIEETWRTLFPFSQNFLPLERHCILYFCKSHKFASIFWWFYVRCFDLRTFPPQKSEHIINFRFTPTFSIFSSDYFRRPKIQNSDHIFRFIFSYQTFFSAHTLSLWWGVPLAAGIILSSLRFIVSQFLHSSFFAPGIQIASSLFFPLLRYPFFWTFKLNVYYFYFPSSLSHSRYPHQLLIKK